MSQEEVVDLLEKVKIPMSAREISEALDIAFALVSCNIKKLIKANEIKILELTREEAAERYHSTNFKRRMRLYYC
jgi:DNA-binding MarR family transcriptional regulator